jgi:hypothetical protein
VVASTAFLMASIAKQLINEFTLQQAHGTPIHGLGS